MGTPFSNANRQTCKLLLLFLPCWHAPWPSLMLAFWVSVTTALLVSLPTPPSVLCTKLTPPTVVTTTPSPPLLPTPLPSLLPTPPPSLLPPWPTPPAASTVPVMSSETPL